MSLPLIIVIVLCIILVCVKTVKVVPQANVYVVERMGKYYKTLDVGMHVIIPFIDQVAQKISLKEQVIDFDPQAVITKDNVMMQIDTVIYLEIIDPIAYCYGSENPFNAIDKLTATTIRNLIGSLELDQTLTSRDVINSKMQVILDEATDKWGIKINRVELKNIIPPRDIQDTMEKQMRAERERREAILQAEGEKEANIAKAEGEKQAAIARAEGEKQAMIAKAQGESEAIRLVAEAKAASIKMINDANPCEQYVQLEGYNALEEIAKSESSKVIIPAEMNKLASTVTTIKELVGEK